jgi:hypothetical protein
MSEENISEKFASIPVPLKENSFNSNASIPYGCTVEHIRLAMQDFINFLGFINLQLFSNGIIRLESMLMPANFSSVVGEFMNTAIPKYCQTLVKNNYHNGHPDLIPIQMFEKNSVQHSHIGIEVKASRYSKGWQGHNAENVWLMVFVFDSNRPVDAIDGIPPKPFQFVKVLGAQLEIEDWLFSGRSETSRRTITASVTRSGYEKMAMNTIYDCEKAY